MPSFNRPFTRSLLLWPVIAAGTASAATTASSGTTSAKSSTTSLPPNVLFTDSETFTASYSGFGVPIVADTSSGRGTTISIEPTQSAKLVGFDSMSLGLSGVLVIDSTFTTSLIKDTSTIVSTGGGGGSSTTAKSSQTSGTATSSQTSSTGKSSQTSNTGGSSQTSNTGKSSGTSNTGGSSQTSTTAKSSQTSNTGGSSQTSSTGKSSQTSSTGGSSQTSNTGKSSGTSSTGGSSQTSNTGKSSGTSSTGGGVIVTTATNSAGSTIVGTETQGGDSSTFATTGLTSFSNLPTSISTTSTSATANGHDSHGNPVLAPWPQCWFCPPGSHGIVLGGLKPGIYPPGGPPAGFPTPFPALTIGPGGDPEYPPKSSADPTDSGKSTGTSETTSSSGSCTEKKTATDITYIVSYGVDTDSSTTATSTVSTEKSVVSGCSVSAVTKTTSTVASCTDGCCGGWGYPSDVELDDSDSDDDTEAAAPAARRAKRTATQTSAPTASVLPSRAGAFELPPEITADAMFDLSNETLHEFQKRTRYVKTFGGCALAATITENDYPKVKDYPNYAGKVKQYFVVTSRQAAAGAACPAPEFYSTDNIVAASTTQGGNAYQTTQPGQVKATPFVNSDHVYEFSILGDFFGSILSGASGAPSCNDFNNFMFGTNNHLANIYKLMPGNTYPDMAAMDAFINGQKGMLYNAGSWPIPKQAANLGSNNAKSKSAAVAAVTSALVNYGMGAAAINNADFVTLFQTTHQRIWQGMTGLDNAIKAACNPPGMQATYADAYSTWMEGFLKTQGESASAQASTAYGSLAANNIPGYAQVQATYPADNFLFKSADLASLDKNQPASPVKRTAACTASGSSSGSGSSSASGSGSSTASGSKTTGSSSGQSSSSAAPKSSSTAAPSTTLQTSASSSQSTSAAPTVTTIVTSSCSVSTSTSLYPIACENAECPVGTSYITSNVCATSTAVSTES